MINRSNYEEYLLLYIDGELSPEVKTQVDAFLEANPDLREELQLLEQTVLQPEEQVRFVDRQELYREENGISIANYQEFFLLYVDGELDHSSSQAVETFVLQNPRLQDEFTLLKQSVLTADPVIFENKASLYRKEEKRKPVVISLFRVSVAAAVLVGIVALLWVLDTGTKTDPISGTQQGLQQPVNNPGDIVPVTNGQELTVAEEKPTGGKIQSNPPLIQPRQSKEVVVELPKQNDPAPLVAELPVIQNSNTPQQSTTVEAENTAAGNLTQQSMVTAQVTQPPVQTAAYPEELEIEEDKTLYVGALEINPDKVRGFFRKAGRLLTGKKNNDESDGKVQVASFEFNKQK
jgi:hypothetical protein